MLLQQALLFPRSYDGQWPVRISDHVPRGCHGNTGSTRKTGECWVLLGWASVQTGAVPHTFPHEWRCQRQLCQVSSVWIFFIWIDAVRCLFGLLLFLFETHFYFTLDMSTKINFISSQRLYKFNLIILSYNQYYTWLKVCKIQNNFNFFSEDAQFTTHLTVPWQFTESTISLWRTTWPSITWGTPSSWRTGLRRTMCLMETWRYSLRPAPRY